MPEINSSSNPILGFEHGSNYINKESVFIERIRTVNL